MVSRRNLLTLLMKLDGYPTESACTITTGNGAFFLKAEEDHVHYADRPPPGVMHPATEFGMVARDGEIQL